MRSIVGTAAALALVLAGGLSATAATSETSTPVPILPPDGTVMSYVVNTGQANPGQTRKAEKAIAAAGGVVVQSWPQIGVIVAQSDRAAFRDDIKVTGKNAVSSVGATRTAEVKDKVTGSGVPWGPGSSGWNQGKNKPVNGDEPSVPIPGSGTEQYTSLQWDMTMIGSDKANLVTDGSRNVLVGVLDSGIDPNHVDLKANIDVANSVNCTVGGRPDQSEGGWYPTTSDHGTHVAGTIAAARNGVGIVGVAPNVRLASVKVVNDDGYIYPEYAICGFMWAAQQGMDVTNNSYYVDPFEFWCADQPDQAAVQEAVTRAVKWSVDKGVVSAAAAGNSALDLRTNTTDAGSPNDAAEPVTRTINSGCLDLPAQLPGVVTVSSITQTGQLSSFSNRGLGQIDVAAPGSRIASTVPGGWAYKNGTSMASPHVAGVLALMKSVHPELTPAQMVEKLQADATPTPCSPPQSNRGAACEGTTALNSYYGYGIVDALKAVQ
ncbi:S8 family serine peptidase [Microbacterium sp. H1-D42]|uniref:S8 family peptidase n=1 Tax=Microbacterium sp. H1-D42 TaxID=2925844 RepID=UPI001F532302|nr:S8 family serine peptidase [Microbacterium sp. H1-D42]UNK69767.1 S8 family serine peptidase [Microbacterium sp. H1-D42]